MDEIQTALVAAYFMQSCCALVVNSTSKAAVNVVRRWPLAVWKISHGNDARLEA